MTIGDVIALARHDSDVLTRLVSGQVAEQTYRIAAEMLGSEVVLAVGLHARTEGHIVGVVGDYHGYAFSVNLAETITGSSVLIVTWMLGKEQTPVIHHLTQFLDAMWQRDGVAT